jgi:hypothetical protein
MHEKFLTKCGAVREPPLLAEKVYKLGSIVKKGLFFGHEDVFDLPPPVHAKKEGESGEA